MHWTKTVAALAAAGALYAAAMGVRFSGKSALKFTTRLVSFGPRPPGSEGLERARAYILRQLAAAGCRASEQAFTAQTPLGPKTMKNIIAWLPGTSGKAVAFTGHYDTKLMPGRVFVGANDGGSSAGLLLELARVLAKQPRRHDVYLVWFDGEEALLEWTEKDSLYGSRELAAKWERDGTLRKLVALINVDMIGDRDLRLVHEGYSAAWLRELAWETAAELGYGRHFGREEGAIGDDHMPFLERGVPALDLIDFTYGPDNRWWHTEQDTVDKLGANSFQLVGDVLIAVLGKLERTKP